MKEIPILFSTAMVQAILAGRKTQTRRVVKPQPDVSEYASICKAVDRNFFVVDESDLRFTCPYGNPGDLLWVREGFRSYFWSDENGYTDFNKKVLDYRADNHDELNMVDADGFQVLNKDGSEKMIPWKPSIHMPKSAARIWLQVEEIRVERLQDISEEDAKAEGIKSFVPVPGDGETQYYHYLKDKWGPSPNHSFQTLWQSINGPESWNENPWIWCVKFKVLSTTGKPEQSI